MSLNAKTPFQLRREQALEYARQQRIEEVRRLQEAGQPIPAYIKPCNPNNCRRTSHHNYKWPGSYMITFSKSPDAPYFSSITGDARDAANPARIILNPVGEFIQKRIWDLMVKYPFMSIPNYVIMPDHVHLLWTVKEFLEKDLGFYVGGLKSRATNDWRNYICPERKERSIELPSLFTSHFNDKIAYTEDHFKRFSHYIDVNPQRRLTAIQLPHLFHRVQGIKIEDKQYDLYGNFQLLRHPLITPVRFSSKYSARELDEEKRKWDETIRAEGVLISPFVHPLEDEYKDRALAEGASIIRMIPEGITPLYKPFKEEFGFCEEGRVLHIGESRISRLTTDHWRPIFLELNKLAKRIATEPDLRMKLVGINP